MRYSSKTLRPLALALSIALLACLLPAPARAANPQTGTEDYASMHAYVTPTSDEGIYKVTMSVEIKQQEINPPALVSIVLDGTQSMNKVTGPSDLTPRDVAVQQAVWTALETLMGDDNGNKKATYINVILYGSYADKAISLTEWATRGGDGSGVGGPFDTSSPKAGMSNWPGLRYMTYPTSPASPYHNSWSAAVNYNAAFDDNTIQNGGSVYVPLLNATQDGLNPVLAGLFNYTGSLLKSGSDATLASNIAQKHFFGNAAGFPTTPGAPGTNDRFPMSRFGTYINYGVQLAYEELSKEINRQYALVTETEFELMKKTVLIMADGDDNNLTKPATQSWAAALKAPYHSPYDTGPAPTDIEVIDAGDFDPTNPTTTFTYSNTTMPGLGADVWALAVGDDAPYTADDELANWTSAFGSGGMSNTGNHMAALTVEVPDATTANGILDISTTPGYASLTQFNTMISNFQASGLLSSAATDRYRRVTDTAAAKNFFTAFAHDSMASGGTDSCTADIDLSEFFEVIQYKSNPLLKTWSNDPSTNPTATYSNGRIDWNLDALSHGISYLEFYVGMVDGLDPALSYPIMKSAVLHYTMAGPATGGFGSGQSYSINFPMPYVAPGGEVSNPEAVETATESVAAAKSESSSLMPLFAIPYTKGIYTTKVHSPSVKTKVDTRPYADEKLNEKFDGVKVGESAKK